MKITFAILAISALVLCTATASYQTNSMVAAGPKNETDPWTEEATISYYIRGSRGIWFGYVEGLYNIKSAKVSDQCLSHDISGKIGRIISEIAL